MSDETRISGYTLAEAQDNARKYARERIKDIMDNLPSKLEGIASGFDCYRRLTDAGFKVNAYSDGDVYLQCKAADLPRVYRAVGSLRMSSKNLHDAEQGTVYVNHRSERYPTLVVSYVKQLPPNSKCKIERKAELVTRLVCSL